MRKAWTSGGIEWNWSPGFIGHSTFTLSPVHAAVLETAKGPVVRVYEFDRIKNTTWYSRRGPDLDPFPHTFLGVVSELHAPCTLPLTLTLTHACMPPPPWCA